MFFHSRSSTEPMCEPLLLHWGRWSAQTVFQILSAVELGFGFLPPQKQEMTTVCYETCKTWDVSTWVKSIQLEREIFNSKYHTTGDIQRSTCQSVGGLLWWSCDFLATLPGKDAIYRYPGSPCYGLLRKRQNGGRPEAQEGPKDTTSCAMWILKHFVYKNG